MYIILNYLYFYVKYIVLRGEEIKNLKTIENIKEYIYCHINGLDQGIIKTYDEDNNKSFEELDYI